MIAINLLPEAHHKPSTASLPKLHRSPLVSLTVAILLGLALVLALVRQGRHMQLRYLTEQLNQLQPKRVKVERLRVAIQRLSQQQRSFEGLKRGEYAWAVRLNALADATPEGVWFTTLSLDPVHGLVLEGAALGQEGQEMVQISQLVQNLKARSTFASAIREIQIESIKSIKDNDIDLTLFTVTCTLEGA
jgi:Tfp pilus assembly protein PilN